MGEPQAKRSKPPPRSKSGKHPAVQAFREKLDSIAENTAPAVADLDKEVTEFLGSVKTPVPPPDSAPSPSDSDDETVDG